MVAASRYGSFSRCLPSVRLRKLGRPRGKASRSERSWSGSDHSSVHLRRSVDTRSIRSPSRRSVGHCSVIVSTVGRVTDASRPSTAVHPLDEGVLLLCPRCLVVHVTVRRHRRTLRRSVASCRAALCGFSRCAARGEKIEKLSRIASCDSPEPNRPTLVSYGSTVGDPNRPHCQHSLQA